MLIYGNVTKSIASNILNIFNRLTYDITKQHNQDNSSVLKKIPNGTSCRNYQVVNRYEKNTAVLYNILISEYIPFVTENWNKLTCLTLLLHKILNNQYFYILRTQEQFGYIVSVKSYSFSGFSKSAYFTDFISFIVQSPNKTSSEIIQRTEDFIQDFYSFLKNLSDADEKSPSFVWIHFFICFTNKLI